MNSTSARLGALNSTLFARAKAFAGKLCRAYDLRVLAGVVTAAAGATGEMYVGIPALLGLRVTTEHVLGAINATLLCGIGPYLPIALYKTAMLIGGVTSLDKLSGDRKVGFRKRLRKKPSVQEKPTGDITI